MDLRTSNLEKVILNKPNRVLVFNMIYISLSLKRLTGYE